MLAALTMAAALAVPPGWTHLSAGALSLDAPPGSTLKLVAPGTWEVHNRSLTLGIAVGPRVADADDGEPRRCYEYVIVLSPAIRGSMRVTRANARADCPTDYASLFVPAEHIGGSNIFVWAWTGDYYAAGKIVTSIRFASAP